MSFHNSVTGYDVHAPNAWTYANATARTTATGFVAGDVGKLALQSSDNTLWILIATTPTWVGVNAATSAQLLAMVTDAVFEAPIA